MQSVKNQQTSPLRDQTNRPQTSSGSSLLFCACCWPSRRARDNSDSNSLRPKDSKTVIFKQQQASNSPRVHRSPSIYLSMTDLNRMPSPTRDQLEPLSSRFSDAGSINDQQFLTARTSRSTDERRYKSMPALVSEIRSEFLGTQLEEMKQEFYTFFRGGPEKPLLTSDPLPSTSTNLPPFPSTESSSKIPDEIKVLDLSALSEEMAKTYKLESTRSLPQTSHSSIELNLIPVRPFIGFLQRSIVRLPDHTHKSIIFLYWCLAFGFQKMFTYPNNNRERDSSQFIARHI